MSPQPTLSPTMKTMFGTVERAMRDPPSVWRVTMHRDSLEDPDPHASLFDHYALAVQLLAERADAQQLILRAFELLLLRDIGLLPDLASEGNTLATLQDEALYVLSPESGLRAAHGDDAHALTGDQWRSLQAAMDEADPFIATLRACAGCQQALQPQLRHLLHYHSGVRVFKTRQLMLDMQAMSRPRVVPEPSPTNLQVLP